MVPARATTTPSKDSSRTPLLLAYLTPFAHHNCMLSFLMFGLNACHHAARERGALLTVFWCTMGPAWVNKVGWQDRESSDVRNWWGVGVDITGDEQEEERVTLIDLRRNGLSGKSGWHAAQKCHAGCTLDSTSQFVHTQYRKPHCTTIPQVSSPLCTIIPCIR